LRLGFLNGLHRGNHLADAALQAADLFQGYFDVPEVVDLFFQWFEARELFTANGEEVGRLPNQHRQVAIRPGAVGAVGFIWVFQAGAQGGNLPGSRTMQGKKDAVVVHIIKVALQGGKVFFCQGKLGQVTLSCQGDIPLLVGGDEQQLAIHVFVIHFQGNFHLSRLTLFLIQFTDDQVQRLAVGAKDEHAFQRLDLVFDLFKNGLLIRGQGAAGRQLTQPLTAVF